MQHKIAMTAFHDETHNPLIQLAILLITFFQGSVLGELLDAPARPQQHVRLLNLMHIHRQRSSFHKIHQRLRRRGHVFLKTYPISYGKRQTGHGYEEIPSAALEPRIARNDVVLIVLQQMELMGGVNETVVESIHGVMFHYLLAHDGIQLAGIHL